MNNQDSLNNQNTSHSTSGANGIIPSAAQLDEVRRKQWHQQGEALLTLENLRSWINAAGLVLFAPRPQIVSPAPTLVEAVLGEANPNPTPAETSTARELLARLVAEGLAVPLNLLGATGTAAAGAIGETPDFVASTAVFSYVFTLRGDKAWKQPPATTGALKVSQLALATFEALTRRGPLSAYDLTTDLGKEVTEAAVVRALGELWTHLRVLPLAQPDGRAAIWELAGTRFVKQIKAGANAGQPSALSALISLYLGQAVVAAEDEIEGFLSPLAARSRIRDVIHALLAARQLDTLAVEGRTVLHVAGELPAFLAPVLQAPTVAGAATEDAPVIAVEGSATEVSSESGEVGPRITKYVPKPRKIGTGYLAKASPAKFGAKTGFGSKDSAKNGFKPRAGFAAAPDRERRPFSKPGASEFAKPWEEEKARRLAAAAKPSDVDTTPIEAAAPDGGKTARAPRAPRKPSFGAKPSFGTKPSFGGKPAFRSEGRPPRREFAARTDGDTDDARPPRKTFSKPGTFGRKREGVAGKPAFGGDARPPRREYAPRGDRPAFGERPARPAFGAGRTPGSFAPRPKGDRPGSFQKDRAPRGEGGGFAPRKPYPPRGAGFFSGQPRPSEGRGERPASVPREHPDREPKTESGKRVYRKFDAPRDRPARASTSDRPARPFSSDRPARPFSSERPARAGGFAGKPSGDYAPRKFAGKPMGRPGAAAGRPSGKPSGGKKPFGKSGGFASKPDSTFAKFADGKKPFGKRPPARKYKPKDESA